jgi:hypothetical protein
MVSGNILCKIGLNVSAQTKSAHAEGNRESCPVCRTTFRRPQDRKRHMLIHLPCWLQCPLPGCAWRGDRWSNLDHHTRKYHSSLSSQIRNWKDDKNEPSTIYDPWPLVEGIFKGEITSQNATQMAFNFVREKARKVDKLELWEVNFWGRKEKKAKGDVKDLVPKAGQDNGSMSGINQ